MLFGMLRSFCNPDLPSRGLLRNLIPAKSVSMFFGEPGSKKTYALLSMAVSVALGKEWLGFKNTPCKVLFIDEEMGEDWVSRRLCLAIHGELSDENTQVEFISFAGFKMDDKKDEEELQEIIQENGYKLVIIDALAEIMDGDENSKQDTLPVFHALKRIAEKTGCAIIVIHHTNWAGAYRGSSSIKGAVDLLVKIDSEEDSEWIDFKSEKGRHIESVKFSAVAHWTEDQFYLELAEKKAKEKQPNRSQAYVLKYLQRHGASKLSAIMGAADVCSPNGARQAIYGLVDSGKIYRINPEEQGRGAEAVYDTTKTEEETE